MKVEYYIELHKRGVPNVKKEISSIAGAIKALRTNLKRSENKKRRVEKDLDELEASEIVEGMPVYVLGEKQKYGSGEAEWIIKTPDGDTRRWIGGRKEGNRYAEITRPTQRRYRVNLKKTTSGTSDIVLSSFPCPSDKPLWRARKVKPIARLEIDSFDLAKRMAFEWVIHGKTSVLQEWLNQMADEHVDFLATDRWGGAGPRRNDVRSQD